MERVIQFYLPGRKAPVIGKQGFSDFPIQGEVDDSVVKVAFASLLHLALGCVSCTVAE